MEAEPPTGAALPCGTWRVMSRFEIKILVFEIRNCDGREREKRQHTAEPATEAPLRLLQGRITSTGSDVFSDDSKLHTDGPDAITAIAVMAPPAVDYLQWAGMEINLGKCGITAMDDGYADADLALRCVKLIQMESKRQYI